MTANTLMFFLLFLGPMLLIGALLMLMPMIARRGLRLPT